MKKLLLLSFIIGALSLHAQNSKVVAAWKYLQDYYNVKDTSSLRNAKEAIDAASVNAATKDSPKTQAYRGKIYQNLFEQKYQVEYDKRQDISDLSKRILEAYFNSNIDHLLAASEAYKKAKELDKKKAYEEEITPHFADCSRHFENIAIANYNQKNYAKALIGFENAMNLNSLNGTIDTTNMTNAKVAAELSQNNDKTKALYEQMLEHKIGGTSTYHNYQYFLITKLNDETKAMEVVKKGRSLYPNDVSLINDETNFYLKSANPDDILKAINNLKLAIEKKTNDAILNLALGNVYDRLANPKADTGKDLPKPADYESLMNNAEKYYKAAYTLNKTDATTLFNLGALYNNKAKLMLEKSTEITDETKFKKAVKEANEILTLAKPYLEAAYQQNEKDCSVILALKRMYISTRENDKYNAMDAKAKALDCK
jgi:tetratricopeptide (TPR) repeat protein